jgi:carbon storage regulator
MLVLTRGIGELILIGDNIELRVLDVRTDRVRIGITAPKGLPITRRAPEPPPPSQSPRPP